MALQFNAVERQNPINKEKKWYASPKQTGKRDLKSISKDLAELSSLSAGDVQNVIVNLIDQLPKWLMEGISVKLDGFGSFRLSFSSDGVVTKEEVTANLIKDLRIIFDADDNIKDRIQKTKVNPAA
ncbi:MAG TPA: HU family DNA-binding protein [Bacteroidales bacterium]|nr:HU family DNA-binding protein [Bacteroidales bacterium]